MIDYTYKPISVPGGGFVTGFVFHPYVENILYCRTDIGGCYRFDFEQDRWISLIDHATDINVWETYPLGIAIDPQNPSYVYTMVGLDPIHKIGCSKDYGRTWTYFDAPVINEKGDTAKIHGNALGRSTGERLIVDPNNSNILYLGTMYNGLWKTTDQCRTWERLRIAFPGCQEETNIAFVEIDPSLKDEQGSSLRLVVSTSGQGGARIENVRGPSVYMSHDGGVTFEPLSDEPKPAIGGSGDYPGYVGQRATFVEKYLFVTYAAYNIGWSNWNSYGCDTGLCYDGAVIRYRLSDESKVIEAADITPKDPKDLHWKDDSDLQRRIGYGMSGISADKNNLGTMICSSICSKTDTIYLTTDYGDTWKPIMSGLDIGEIEFTVNYHKPEYNGNASLVHWMSDIKINPFNSDMAFFNTGAGVFITKNLTQAFKNETVRWSDCSFGMEETVHLNIYSPPDGEVKLIDIIGDYGGIAVKDLDLQVEKNFSNAENDRWITAMNADYPDAEPSYVVTAPRGNWTGTTKGGIIVSNDQGDTWKQLPMPHSLGDEIDKLVEYLKTPNVTAGWVAVGADGKTILWGIGLPIYASTLVYSDSEGERWYKSKVFTLDQEEVTLTHLPLKVMSDRVEPTVFYGFGNYKEGPGLFVSVDRGSTFRELLLPEDFPKVDLAGIDSEQTYEIRVESGAEGIIWLALNENGLWKLTYDKGKNKVSCFRVSQKDDITKRVGLGKPPEGSRIKVVFTSGIIQGVYGFYRSIDGGYSWSRINTDETQFGDIRSISGDPRVFGRIYVATGTRGLVYGDPRI